MRLAAAAALVLLFAAANTAADAQTQMFPQQYMAQRPDSVRPNSQNLMTGPSYWTPLQRRLNVPSANANPSLRLQNNPTYFEPRAAPQAPPRPAETPLPAETPNPGD